MRQALLILLLLFGCSKNEINARFVSTSNLSIPLTLEIADDENERAKGLMFRRSLEENSGMLFIFQDDSVRSFWMKNTYIPLDMIFVDSNKKVVGILKNVPPLTEDPRSVGKPSRYVVELAAGETDRLGIGEGSVLEVYESKSS